MNSTNIRVLTVMGAFFLCSSCKSNKEEAIAQVGGTSITAADFASRLRGAPPAYQQYAASPEGRKQFLNLMIREKVLLVESKKAGLERNDDYKNSVAKFKKKWERDLRDYQDTLLIEMYLSKLRAKDITVSDADTRAYYDSHEKDYAHPIEIQASHILLNSPEDAEKALARIKGGESFESVARAMSMDPSTAVDGGKLKPFTKGRLPEEFEAAVIPLKNGQLSSVVKTTFGYHIIKKNGQRTLPGKSYDVAKDEIRARMERDKFDQWVTKAQADLGVKIDETALARAVTPRTPGSVSAGGANGEGSVQ